MNKFIINASTKKVLSLIIKHQPISRKEISELSGFSKPAVTYSINSLLEIGLAVESGDSPSSSNGGPRPKNLYLNNKFGYIISILIRSSVSLLKVCSINGEILSSYEFNSNQYENFNFMIKDIIKVSKSILDEYTLEKNIGIGVSIPGTVKDNKVIFSPIYDVDSFDIENEFLSSLKTDIFFERDVYNMAHGERWFGLAQKYSDYFCIWSGTGIGGVAVVNSKLVKGVENFAGEIGFLITDSSDVLKTQTLNSFGSFEKRASIGVIENKHNLETKKLIEEFNDDETIKKEIIKSCENLARGLANIILVLNPEAIIINGRFRLLEKTVENILNEELKRICPVFCKIEYSKMGSDAIILGGVYHVLNKKLDIEL